MRLINYLLERLIKLLEGNSKLAELVRLLVCGSLFFGAVYWVKHDSVDTARALAKIPENMSQAREKNLRDARNQDVIEAARKEYREIMIKACEAKSKSRFKLIECIKEIED